MNIWRKSRGFFFSTLVASVAVREVSTAWRAEKKRIKTKQNGVAACSNVSLLEYAQPRSNFASNDNQKRKKAEEDGKTESVGRTCLQWTWVATDQTS